MVMMKERIGMRIQNTKKRINILTYSRARATFEGLEIASVPRCAGTKDNLIDVGIDEIMASLVGRGKEVRGCFSLEPEEK
jgi:hypothetical protein